MQKAGPWGLLGGQAGESADRRNKKIESVTNNKKCPAWEKGRTRPNEQFSVLRDVGRGRSKIKSLKDCVD